MHKHLTLKDAQRVLDRHILQRMEENRNSVYGRSGTAFHFDFLTEPPELTRDMVRAVCRSLTDRGYCFYMCGLFDEYDRMSGAGYGITDKGAEYLETLLAEDAATREQKRQPQTEVKTMSNMPAEYTPQHLSRYYRQVFALLAAQTALTKVIARGDLTSEEMAEAEAERDRAFGRVFGVSIDEARRMSAKALHVEECG